MTSDLLEIRHLTHASRNDPEPHAHRAGQLFTVSAGLISVEAAGGRWLMPPASCGWIPPQSPHGAAVHGDMQGLSLYFDEDWSRRHLPAAPKVARITPLLAALLAEIAASETWPPARREPYLLTLADVFHRQPAQPFHLPMPRDARLLRLATGLLERPDDSADLDDWAKRVGMTRRTLTRRFLQETGLSFGQWRQQMRLLAALERLADGMAVTTTALETGYGSVSAFGAMFRRYIGSSPAAWRDEALGRGRTG